ncbi:unnamed protein product [Pleuronectes platessa]|uniref:Uncharacterized protein n=1 Tax=Pleuronectes platessa TaxID=8262 RepID=A0A9N7VWZ5_PLEPL|nr:unnamed protein product [Pleuronectes platessa]
MEGWREQQRAGWVSTGRAPPAEPPRRGTDVLIHQNRTAPFTGWTPASKAALPAGANSCPAVLKHTSTKGKGRSPNGPSLATLSHATITNRPTPLSNPFSADCNSSLIPGPLQARRRMPQFVTGAACAERGGQVQSQGRVTSCASSSCSLAREMARHGRRVGSRVSGEQRLPGFSHFTPGWLRFFIVNMITLSSTSVRNMEMTNICSTQHNDLYIRGKASTGPIRSFEEKTEAGMTGNVPAMLSPIESLMPERFEMKLTDH